MGRFVLDLCVGLMLVFAFCMFYDLLLTIELYRAWKFAIASIISGLSYLFFQSIIEPGYVPFFNKDYIYVDLSKLPHVQDTGRCLQCTDPEAIRSREIIE